MIVHESSLGTIEFTTIKNRFIKKETNYVIFKIKKLTNEESVVKKLYSDILKFYKEQYTKKTEFIQIYDFTETSVSNIFEDLTFGKQYGNFLRDKAEKFLTTCCIGTSIIVNSEIVKGLVNSALYFYTNVKPTKVHSSYAEAYEWLSTLI
jgi:hypothetical protein